MSSNEHAGAHLATPEWQSFESRMRGRKAERCLQRAQAAIAAGDASAARQALDEARVLSPDAPALRELEQRAYALTAPPAAAPRAWPRYVAVAIIGLLGGAAIGWEAWIRWPAGSFVSVDQARVTPAATQGAESALPAPDASSGSAVAPTDPIATPDGASSAPTTSDLPVPQSVSARPIDEPVESTADASPAATKRANALLSGTTGTDGSPGAPRTSDKASVASPSASPRGDRALGDDRRGVERPTRNSAPDTAGVDAAAERIALERSTTSPSAGSAAPTMSAPAAAGGIADTSNLPVAPPPIANAPSLAPRPASASARDEGTATRAPVPANSRDENATRTPVPASPRDESAAIRATLGRYESAYSDLDVDGVRAVWPTLDTRALSHAFESLASQRIALQNCAIDVNGASAQATCSGRAAWTPRVGGGQQSASRTWTFNLTQSSGAWRIVRVQAR